MTFKNLLKNTEIKLSIVRQHPNPVFSRRVQEQMLELACSVPQQSLELGIDSCHNL
jgi:hypothetical protein